MARASSGLISVWAKATNGLDANKAIVPARTLSVAAFTIVTPTYAQRKSRPYFASRQPPKICYCWRKSTHFIHSSCAPRCPKSVKTEIEERPALVRSTPDGGLQLARNPGPFRARFGLRRRNKWHFHSITSSARESSTGGMVRPSASAVFRLMTKSNLVAN
jgi:hypothetical protein